MFTTKPVTNLGPVARCLERQNDGESECTQQNAADEDEQGADTEVADGRPRRVRHVLRATHRRRAATTTTLSPPHACANVSTVELINRADRTRSVRSYDAVSELLLSPPQA